jgi:predicted DNA-binding transcriptional regulator YafY
MGGYRFDKPNAGDKIELPGLWFSEKEATALVLMQHLLANLDTSGLLSPHIAPLMDIVDGILGQSEVSAKELRKRIKVFGMSARKNVLENFEEVGVSLLKRQRLHLSYYSKGKDELTERAVSPQRLIFYHMSWKIKPLRLPKKNCMRTLRRVMASSPAKPRSVPSYALLLRKHAGCLLRPGMVSK